MMHTVSPQVNFMANAQVVSNEQRKQKQEQVATGIGGAAGVTATATKYAGRKGLRAQASEKFLGELSGQVAQGIKKANEAQEVATGLFATFKKNFKMYSASVLEQLNKLKNSKFIGPIVKSPIAKKVSAVAGGALAFFVLITGVNKAVKTGAVAVNDFKSQYREYKDM